MAKIQVRTSYKVNGWFGARDDMDAAARAAVGRSTDFSGSGFGERDIGWFADSDFEARRIAKALRKIGLQPEIYKPKDAA